MNQALRKPTSGVLILFLMLLGAASLTAQDRVIRGKVVDNLDQPIPGATIVVKGTVNGTVSDVDGNYAITVSEENAVLVISSTGYEKQEIPVGTQTTIDIKLEDSDALLSELVVTGYTVDTRKQTTSAVATVKTKDLAVVPTGNVEQQLQGRVPGLTVITNGQPGTTSQVRIHGFGSFTGNQPLYIVDGVPTQNINFLSPDDIENTTVMKDASSASIYGARAAGGVIVITTKRGSKRPQKLQVAYDGLVGWTDPGDGLGILNPQDQADWTWIALKNAGSPTTHEQYGSGDSPVLPDYINVGGLAGLSESQVNLEEEKKKYNINPEKGSIYQIVRANKAGTDWYDAITRTAMFTRHNLGFSGATENARYYLGLSLQDQEGILLNNDFSRYTFRINTEFSPVKRLRIGENVQFTYRQVLGLSGGGGGANVPQDENEILFAFRMPSIIPVYDEAINLGISDTAGYAGTAAKGFNNPANPRAIRDGLVNDHAHQTNGFGNLYAEYDILNELTFRTSIGGNIGGFYGYGYTRKTYENSENNASFGYQEFSGSFFTWVFTNTLQYKKQFGIHNLDVLGGLESLSDGNFRNIAGSGLDPFSQSTDYITLSTVSNRVVNSSNETPWNYFSMFGRVHYSLLDKYYITGVIRRDGSSRFGASNRYGVFPGVSAAWRISGEDFMQGVSWLDDLKIRAGWGQMGNDQVNPTNQYSLYASSLGNAAYDINGTNSSVAEGFYQSQIGNPNAKWEVSTTTNVGFDALMFQGKLDVIVDFWKKNTDELLFNPPQAHVIGGFANAPFKNVASMVNKGIDLQIVNKGRFGANSSYELTLVGSWLDNEITKVDEGLDYFDVNPASNRLAGTMIRNQVGYSISAFYGYQVVGLFNTDNVVPDSVQAGAGPGRFIYADLNGLDDNGNPTGRPDGKIDAADRTYIGSPVPKFTGGVNFKVTLGQFDVETYLYTSLGNKIFHLSKWFTDFYPSFKGAAIGERVKEDSWSTTNTGSENPIFEDVSNFSTNTQPNSWYVEDGSYLRIQNLSFGYTLPTSLMNKWKMKRARVYVSANNLFTFSGYQGLDPAVGGAVDTNFGIDVGNYPVTRSYMFGVGVTF